MTERRVDEEMDKQKMTVSIDPYFDEGGTDGYKNFEQDFKKLIDKMSPMTRASFLTNVVTMAETTEYADNIANFSPKDISDGYWKRMEDGKIGMQ